MSDYSFSIRECQNGWLLKRIEYLSGEEYFPTLQELCLDLLEHVDDRFPKHRRTGAKSDPRVREILGGKGDDLKS